MESQTGFLDKMNVNHKVFWPPFFLFLFATFYSYMNNEGMVEFLKQAHSWVSGAFGWAFALMPFLFVLLMFCLCFSQIGDVRFGGKDAKPEFSTWNWFAMSLCSGIAIGIVFWGVAEPIMHLGGPPESLGLEPNSAGAAVFAISTTFLHWTISPYAIYLICALPIALAVYNYGQPFSVSSGLYFLIGSRINGWIGKLVDSVCIFAEAVGLSMALGFGLMQISDGLNVIFGIPSGQLTWIVIGLVTITAVILSSYSGVNRGIRILSDNNAKIFIGLLIFVLITGPTAFILDLGIDSLGEYITNFAKKSLWTGTVSGDQWPRWWTHFYMGGWFVFAPLVGLFLARLGKGRTVRQFILVNLFAPAIFGMTWFSVFGGSAIHMQIKGVFDIATLLKSQGIESAVFIFLQQFPFYQLLQFVFWVTIIISFTTMADSMTTVISAMSTKGLDPKNPEAPFQMKFIWAVLIGASALFIISTAGIDGIKMLAVFCGLPLLILITFLSLSLLKGGTKSISNEIFEVEYRDQTADYSMPSQKTEVKLT